MNIFGRWLQQPTRGELRAAELDALRAQERRPSLDGLRWKTAADRLWIEHKAGIEHCGGGDCFRAGFLAGLKWYRSTQE